MVRNWVTKIHRDSQGYLWFCTVEGISVFDGYRFTNFSTRDGLPSRLVLDMIESRGDFWFATAAGLARFHKNHANGATFDAVRVGDTKESNSIQTLYESRDGTIWCGTGGGLYGFRPHDSGARPQVTPLDGPEPLEVQALAEDSRGNLWISTPGALFRLRPDNQIYSLHLPNSVNTHALLVDSHDRLWVGGFGMAGVDTAVEPPRVIPAGKIPYKEPGVISVLYQGEHGEIWVGGSAGLARMRPDATPPQVLAYRPSAAFPIEHVGAIGQDTRHNLWLAIGSRGAARIAAGSFELFTRADGLAADEVLGMVESFQGNLFAVTGQWTLNEFRGSRFAPTRLKVPSPGATWAVGQTVVQDEEGVWWAASGAGVARYAATANIRELRGKLPERVYSIRDGLPSATVLRLFRDSHGDIWAGTIDGIGHWNRATRQWRAYRTNDLMPASKGAASVHSFAEDDSGAVWAGMYPSGLVRFRGATCELLTREVPPGAINSLISDRHGRLWIGSSQGGVGRMDHPSAAEPRIQRYGLEQGIASEQVFSLAEDNAGRIYVAGGRGVDRLDPETATLHHFTASSGLPPGDTQFLFRDHDGSIWFASFYGLARYRPEPDETPETPAPLLRALRVGGDSYPISETGERAVSGMTLAPGHNSLEVEFRALHFDIGGEFRYQYWLEGADTDWSKPSDYQTVRYANLSPGKYRFAVRTVAESGQVSTGQATLAFQVIPAFYRRGWFLGIVLLVIAGGAYSVHRYRLNHLLALERVGTRLAADLHDDMGAGLAEIAILSEVAKLEGGPRTMELLDGIAGRARALREAMADIVWTVDPREDGLADLVLRLRHTAFSMLESEDRAVEFVAGEGMLEIELSPTVRRHVLLFFKEVVTNVARHAAASKVFVEIEAVKGRFRLSIRDNGRGFDPQQPVRGRGLKSLKYRASELQGTMHVESSPGGGTEIELTILL